ncbi:NAD(P)/FAD-dependent oxidoreductase [Caproiciproducens sp. MSJ-32]|uniref:NAD(P)/FAD-dependent oxidoreductase n=1 Tax=Caproiciproducens sp. MSJ-32 TaxID=2841527 RepID=UPI001C1242FC|nr:NAD(P)/FAD-dependent oxidoreductase [Caproiciproducens sp. MSJ-32]MBU5454831.1 NAD(P)/FAD-dependent oxidoreductase [Caproiciproducens sp. MSJ-32]
MLKVLVIGAGPAGIMAALTAVNDNKVILIEGNNEIGKKLKLTGGGRCNITNYRDINEFFDKIVTNSKFLYSALYSFTNEDLLNFFRKGNLEYKVEFDNDYKVYTKNDKADDVIELLKNDLERNKVKILYNTKVKDLIISDNIIRGVITDNNEKIYADKVVIATGGKSYPTTGSDGSMYGILEKHGHKINPQYPALIPLVIKEGFIKELQGISMKEVVIKAKIKNKRIEKEGDMIFTHFGISGPAVLKFSSHINKILDKQNVEIVIDFLKNISKEELSKIIRSNKSKLAIHNLKGYLPSKFVELIGKRLNIEKIKAADLRKEDEAKLIENIKEMKLTVENTITIKAAMVTSGGVNVKEINSSTMESKIIKNLYFAGEVIDVDAETGGYNLQIAFSTGHLAGKLL